VANRPQQLTGDRLYEVDRRSVEVVLGQRRAGDRLEFAGVDLIRQTDGVHAHSGILGRQCFSGCCGAVVRLTVGDDDADVVDVWTVAVVLREHDGSHESER